MNYIPVRPIPIRDRSSILFLEYRLANALQAYGMLPEVVTELDEISRAHGITPGKRG